MLAIRPPILKPFVANLSTPAGRIADVFRSHWSHGPESLETQIQSLRSAGENGFGVASTKTPWGGFAFDGMTRGILLEQIGANVKKLAALDPNQPDAWPATVKPFLSAVFTGDEPRLHRYAGADARALTLAERGHLLHALVVEGDPNAQRAVAKMIETNAPAFTSKEVSDALVAHTFATKQLFGQAPFGRIAHTAAPNEFPAGSTPNVSVLPTKSGTLAFYFTLPSHPALPPAKAAEMILAGTSLEQRGGIERVGGLPTGRPVDPQPKPIGEQYKVSYSYAFEAAPAKRA